MNRLTKALAEVCRERPLDEKWIVAPSLRIGNQWIETVARSGRAVVNANVTTARRMALDLSGPALAARGAGLASRLEVEALVDAACRALGREGGYLLVAGPPASLTRAVAAAVGALRAAGLAAPDLDPGRFEVDEKGRELAAVLEAYVAALGERGLVDHADVCRLAAERVARDGSALPPGLAVLVPDDADLEPLERAMLDALPARVRVALPTDEPGRRPPGGGPLTDAALLGWVESPQEAPEPRGDGTARAFSADGEVNEVREALRRALAEGVPLDHVELLHTDHGTYVPLVYETFARVGRAEGPGLGGLAVTFDEGIPARYTRPGRALAAWAAWGRDGCPQAALVRMLGAGLLEAPEAGPGEPAIGSSEIAGFLGEVAVGPGRESYLPGIDEAIAAAERASRRRRRGDADEPEEGEVRRVERARRRASGLRALRGLVKGLVDLVPGPDAPEPDVLRAGARFVRGFARVGSELDAFARDALAEEIDDVLAVLGGSPGAAGPGSWEWLAALPGETRVGGSGPRPGCLHVANVLSGGHSGRPHTFIVGLDDARFPGPGLQDPVLLDGERDRLAEGRLRTAARRLAERIGAFSRTLARLRGRVTLSYSCRSLVDDREGFASPLLLSAYRILSGERDADQAGLARWLGEPASFAPSREEGSLDEAEWWLWRARADGGPEDPQAVVRGRYPNLARGAEARGARGGPEFTVYDGSVPEAGAELDPTSGGGRPTSASALETAGRCPRAYFFKYALRIEPPDEPGADPDRWLDPAARGSLLHGVFRAFVAQLVAAGERPVYSRHAARLREILDEQVALLREETPPPSEGVFRREHAGLVESARIFLSEEEVLCRESAPEFLEASVGLAPEGGGTAIDTEEPVPIALPDGRRILVRGRLDRVDRVGRAGDDRFAVWDYKTGSTFRYRDPDPFWQGRNVQHALYLRMAEAVLREKVSPDARVALFGYFFPGPAGQGERRTYTPDDLACGREVVASLCDTVAGGAFAATDRADDCGVCDYRPICGQTDEEAAVSRRKLDHEANAELAAFRALRSAGGEARDGG